MPKVSKKTKTDEFIGSMDEFAKDLMDLAKGAKPVDENSIALQTRLDVFRQLAAWVAIKHRILDGDGDGDDLDDLKRRLRATPSTPRSGKARIPGPGGDHVRASWAKNGAHYPDGNGGSALEAVKRQLPSANARNDDDASDDSEC